jgi:hypothetical protein
MKTKKLSIAAALMLSAAAAFGSRTDAGTWAFGGTLFVDPSSFAGTDFRADIDLGFYIQNGLMVGGEFAFADNDYTTTFALNGIGKWHFLDNGGTPFSPFLVAAAGLANFQTAADDITALVFGARVGFDFFLTENAAIETVLGASVATDDIYADNDDDKGATNIDITLKMGLMFFF